MCELEVSAYHEAGHAVTAIRLGAIVQQITIEPAWDDGPDRFADVQVAWPVDQFDDRQLQQGHIRVALSGPVAEMIYTEAPLHPGVVGQWQADWLAAWSAAATLFSQQGDRLVFLERATLELYAELQRDENWQMVAVLADHLLAHETLDREMVVEAISPWRG